MRRVPRACRRNIVHRKVLKWGRTRGIQPGLEALGQGLDDVVRACESQGSADGLESPHLRVVPNANVLSYGSVELGEPLEHGGRVFVKLDRVVPPNVVAVDEQLALVELDDAQ